MKQKNERTTRRSGASTFVIHACIKHLYVWKMYVHHIQQAHFKIRTPPYHVQTKQLTNPREQTPTFGNSVPLPHGGILHTQYNNNHYTDNLTELKTKKKVQHWHSAYSSTLACSRKDITNITRETHTHHHTFASISKRGPVVSRSPKIRYGSGSGSSTVTIYWS